MILFGRTAQFFAEALSGTSQAREHMHLQRLFSIAFVSWLIVFCKKNGWIVISMKTDWKRIFPFDK